MGMRGYFLISIEYNIILTNERLLIPKEKVTMSEEQQYTLFDQIRSRFNELYLSLIKKGILRVMNEDIEIQEYIEESGEFWSRAVKDMLKESLTVIESASRQIITVNGIVIGIYFHAITYSKAAAHLTAFASVIYLAPVVCWLISLIFSLLVVGPKLRPMRFLNEEIARQDFFSITQDKFQKYRRSIISFIAGVGFLLVVLFHYLLIFPHKG
jgi:hypothetical protein